MALALVLLAVSVGVSGAGTLSWEMLQRFNFDGRNPEGWTAEAYRGLVTINFELDPAEVRAIYGQEHLANPYRPALCWHVSARMVYSGSHENEFWNEYRSRLWPYLLFDEKGQPVTMPGWPAYALLPSRASFEAMGDFLIERAASVDPCAAPFGLYLDDANGWYPALWRSVGMDDATGAVYAAAFTTERDAMLQRLRAALGETFVLTMNWAKTPGRPSAVSMDALNGLTVEGDFTTERRFLFIEQWRRCLQRDPPRPYWLASWNAEPRGLERIATAGSHWCERTGGCR
jgi:hypothetical protein